MTTQRQPLSSKKVHLLLCVEGLEVCGGLQRFNCIFLTSHTWHSTWTDGSDHFQVSYKNKSFLWLDSLSMHDSMIHCFQFRFNSDTWIWINCPRIQILMQMLNENWSIVCCSTTSTPGNVGFIPKLLSFLAHSDVDCLMWRYGGFTVQCKCVLQHFGCFCTLFLYRSGLKQ